MSARRVIYWAARQFAKTELRRYFQEQSLFDGIVVDSTAELFAALPGAFGIVLYDMPEAEARKLIDHPDFASIQWLHFLMAGREGFTAAGLPDRLLITGADGCVAPTVAEHAVGMALMLGRCFQLAATRQFRREWNRDLLDYTFSLEQANVVIVGYGHIGRQIEQRMHAFGACIHVVNRSAIPEIPDDRQYSLERMSEALRIADVLILTLPLTPRTQHLINGPALAKMKRSAILINVARGGLVDENALIEALSTGQIAGAATDVTTVEPLPVSSPLWDCPNLFITPHCAASGSQSTYRRICDSIEQGFSNALALVARQKQ